MPPLIAAKAWASPVAWATAMMSIVPSLAIEASASPLFALAFCKMPDVTFATAFTVTPVALADAPMLMRPPAAFDRLTEAVPVLEMIPVAVACCAIACVTVAYALASPPAAAADANCT